MHPDLSEARMLGKIFSVGVFGIDGYMVEVEFDVRGARDYLHAIDFGLAIAVLLGKLAPCH